MAHTDSEGILPMPPAEVIPVHAGGRIRARYTTEEKETENRTAISMFSRIVIGMAQGQHTHVLKALVFNDRGFVVYADSLPGFRGLGQGEFE